MVRTQTERVSEAITAVAESAGKDNPVFPDGLWPVMLTPFTRDNEIDYGALERLISWYENQGADGLFAVCQSSEMFGLSLEERVKLAAFVKERSRLPVIASGHIGESIQEQKEELAAMAHTGIDALILISNRLAAQEEPDTVFLENLEKLMEDLPKDLPLGFYECPYPYKRILSPAIVRYLADTGRFYIIKDTCCDGQLIREKLKAARGSCLKIYNANTATLVDSLRAGAAGYSGVMANFHPALYRRLLDCVSDEVSLQTEEGRMRQAPGREDCTQVEELGQFLTMCSFIERYKYPLNAKYAQHLLGNGFELVCRTLETCALDFAEKENVRQLLKISERVLETV